VNKTVPLNPSGTLTIENHKGAIRVSTWDRPDVEISARIEAEPGERMNQRSFELTEILIDSSADAVRVRTKYPDFGSCCWDGNNPEVRYNVRMPHTARLIIRDHRSETDVAGLGGALDIDTHRGTVHVKGLAGPLQLTTHRGEAHVEFSSFSGDSAVETHRGSVELSLPRNSKFEFEADTDRRASVSSDFAMAVDHVDRRKAGTRGAVNGGGPRLRIRSHRGDIRVRAL
jgi:hypothetical protein